jgi:hypothetical protein
VWSLENNDGLWEEIGDDMVWEWMVKGLWGGGWLSYEDSGHLLNIMLLQKVINMCEDGTEQDVY